MQTDISPAGFSVTVTTRWGNRCVLARTPKHQMKTLIMPSLGSTPSPQGSIPLPKTLLPPMHFCRCKTVAGRSLLCSVLCSLKTPSRSASMPGTSKYSTTLGTHHVPRRCRAVNRLFVRYGAPLRAVQGIWYIDEIISRPTDSPAHRSLQIKSTLLSSPVTFPSDRTLYVDFSRDNSSVGAFATMGSFNQTGRPLDTTKIVKNRTWMTSEMVPFSAHTTVEMGFCPPRSLSLATTRSLPVGWWDWMSGGGVDDDYEGKEEYVRIFVNGAIQPWSSVVLAKTVYAG